ASQRVLPGMEQLGWGRIVNLGATSGLVRSHSVYGLAKAALLHMTESMAIEFAPHVTVNAVVPSQIGSGRPDRLPAHTEAAPADRDGAAVHSHERAFLDAGHGVVPHGVVLADAVVARLAARGHRGIGLAIVGVDVEGHEPERVERLEGDDVPVVRRENARARDVGAGAGADVGHPGLDAGADGREQPRLAEALQQCVWV